MVIKMRVKNWFIGGIKMSQVLSQEEVDRLLREVDDGDDLP